jgi:hypothetical protein
VICFLQLVFCCLLLNGAVAQLGEWA